MCPTFCQSVSYLIFTVLVLLLRLRQICNHPALISKREDDPEAAGRTRAEAEVERAIKSFGAGFVAKVRAKIRDLETERMEAELTVRELGSSSGVDDFNEGTTAIRG
jgi:SNF2 family DNA or RNA helicase